MFQKLVFQGKLMDDAVMKDISEGCTIDLALKMRVHVRTATGMLGSGIRFTLNNVNLGTSPQKLKEDIESETGILLMFQKLLFQGKLIDDDVVKKISEGCTIDLAPNGPQARSAFASIAAQSPHYDETRMNQDVTIHCKGHSDDAHKYIVPPRMLVEDLKTRVRDRYRVPKVNLIHACTILHDGFALCDYNIQDSALVHIVMVPTGKGMGSTMAWKNRIQRVLRPLNMDLPKEYYPKALKRVAGDNNKCCIMEKDSCTGCSCT